MRILDITHKYPVVVPNCGSRRSLHRLVLACVLLFCISPVIAASSITLLALFEEKALLHIDGERRLLHTGDTSPEGLILISANTEEAVVEIDGRQEVLRLGMAATFPEFGAEPDPAWAGPQSVSMWADPRGFFYVQGMINGFPVRFLVDTGATTVAISSDLARRVGIDYTQGRRGIANTAGGTTQMYGLELNSVTAGGIIINNVQAGVVIGSFPLEPLLGMSFLSQLDMVREGDRMELKRRY
jgi:aspartyl protease family protein